ncbi:MAG TPA: right-handed parallel beta-helix repeat-containing protein, partial [Flavipsychrobacter sp.]|nr:right-handed parallel beta-helix repeat-containing protein [Flavipsychrobacter sp.]
MKKIYSLVVAFVAIVLSAGAQTTVQIGTGTSTSVTYGPFYRTTASSTVYESNKTLLFTEAELNAAGIFSGATISEIKWYKTDANNFSNGATATVTLYAKNAGTLSSYNTGVNVQSYLPGFGSAISTVNYNTTTNNIPGANTWVGFTGLNYAYTGGSLEFYVHFDITPGTGNPSTGGFSWQYLTNATAPDYRYLYSNVNATSTSNFTRQDIRPNTQFTFTSPACTGTPVAGTASATPTSGICIGSSVNLSLTGNSTTPGQSYDWQTSTSLSGPFTSVSGTILQPAYTATVGTSGSVYYRAAVTCGSNTVYSDTVAVVVSPPMPANTYTINSTQATGGTNFQSFTHAIAALSCGIAGPVTFNVATGSGPYVEQLTIPQIGGASSTNTITFNGNGNSLDFSTLNSSSNRAGIKLDGADHITINNLVLNGADSAYGWGIHFTNGADSNTISNCTINVSKSVTSQNHNGIVFSNSATTAASSGNNGNGNLIVGNTINGGYYNVAVYGGSSTINNDNIVQNNNLKDFYLYGVYTLYNSGLIISGNDISRPTRTNTGTASGILISTGNINNLVEKNRIHNVFDSMTTSTSAFTAIEITGDGTPGLENKIINNAIYNINGNGVVYGIQSTTSLYCHIYHNTISLDDLNATPTGITYGFYQSGTAAGIRFVNNIVSISRGGSGAKYAIYKATPANVIAADSNVYFLNSAGSGAQSIGYQTTAQATLQDWTTASGNDANSIFANPLYVNPAIGDLTPANSLIDNRGTPLGITTDIVNATRSGTTPDVGAYEFSVPLCGGTPTAGNASSPTGVTYAGCVGGSVNIALSGFSIGNGISIIWEESPAGAGMWTPIAGATSSVLNATIAAATDYRARVTCSNGGGFDVSNSVNVNTNLFYQCYCSPLSGVQLHTGNSNYQTNVTIVGTTLNHTTTAVGPQGHTLADHTVPTQTAILTQGQSYPINVTRSSATYSTELWIDWDQSGSFDSFEYRLLVPGSVATDTIHVPI